MSKYINKLNSIQILFISGGFLIASFVQEYILPIMEIDFEFLINPAWISLFLSGIPIAYSAIVNTAKLITIAMIAAVYFGDVFAAGVVVFIMSIGEWLEERTVEKAKKGIESLLNLVPTTGRRIVKNVKAERMEEAEEIVPSEEIKIGDIIRVLPGESFAADGVVVTGNTSVDQSIMTGESLPVDKVEGDVVFAGTINRFGAVDIRVSKSFENSSLQKMIKLVEDAENNKAPTQKIVDKWASVLVPTACVIAIVTYCIFRFLFGEPDDALIRAVTVLVVFCPCALALATPTSIMAAIGQATKNGVLIKSGEALERMGNVTTVAFDKTGTITHGKLTVTDIDAYDISEEKLMILTASVESRSEHPIGKAVLEYSRKEKIAIKEIEGFEMSVGKGVSGYLDKENIFCGNERLITDSTSAVVTEDMKEKVDNLRKEGKAIIIVSTTKTVLGIIGLSDTIKETSPIAIENLKKAGIDKTILLTGDNEKSANFISRKVGITDVYSSLLPEGKVNAIKKLMDKGEKVCMVGDGVNDAPALKSASVGIAMGTMGSDIAVEASDIAIMGDDISKISYIKKLSNATIYSIKFNITLAMVINFGAIILSIMGILVPATGALVHNAGSVIVVLNAARLYEKKIDG